MSDFQPMFEPSSETSEFVALDVAGEDEFEPMAFAVGTVSPDGFEPTVAAADPAGSGPDEASSDRAEATSFEGKQSADGAQPSELDEPGDESEPGDGDDASGEASVEDGEVLPARDADDLAFGEESEFESAETAESAELDPAIRAIEAAAQEAGYEAGMRRGRAEIAERLKEVEDIVSQVEGLRAEFFARAVVDVGRTVTKVAEQVIRRELSVSSGDIEGVVRGILADVQSDDDFVIRVSEADAETLRESYPSLLDLVGRDAGLRIEIDSRLLSGGAVVETSYGKIDASIEQQLRAFAAGVDAWVTAEVEANDD